MNKKTIITVASLIAGTSMAFANGINLDVKSTMNLNNEFKSEHSDGKKYKNDSSKTTKTDAEKITELKARGLKEIDTRITSLTNLNAKIQANASVTTANKATLGSKIQTEITTLTALRAKISADTDLATLKTDVASITKLFRIYALMIPKYNLAAKVETHFATLAKLATTSAALSTDIQTAQTAGKDVTGLRTILAGLNLKLADATAQSNAALALTAPLLPDMGSSTVRAANKQALADAYAKYKLSLKDIKEVKTSARSIIKQLHDWGIAVTATINTH